MSDFLKSISQSIKVKQTLISEEKKINKTIKEITKSIKSGGKILLNIVDPQIKTKRYKVCDDMIKYIHKVGDFKYDGWILQRMKGGPAKKGLCGENWFGEPIFSFTKC